MARSCGYRRPSPLSSAPQFLDASVNVSIGIILTYTSICRIRNRQLQERPNGSLSPKLALRKTKK